MKNLEIMGSDVDLYLLQGLDAERAIHLYYKLGKGQGAFTLQVLLRKCSLAGSLRAANDFSLGMSKTFPMRRSKSLSPPNFSFFEPTPTSDQGAESVKQRFTSPAGCLPNISVDQLRTINQIANPTRRLPKKEPYECFL